MKLITLYLPERFIEALDQLVDARFYPSRAEVIRTAIRDLIKAEGNFEPKTDYAPPSLKAQAAVEREVQEYSRHAPKR